jgi:hypothetical protein
MDSMLHRSLIHLAVAVAVTGLALSSLTAGAQDTDKRGRKYKAPLPTARIEVTILRDTNGKPIENAAVVFHPMQGEKDKGNMELKTNEDGKTIIDVLPIGDVVRLQVIAKGFQTYGEDYKIEKAEMAIEIKLKRPGEQYSIYKKHDEAADAAAPSSTSPSADAGKDAAKTPPAGSTAKPNPAPTQTQPQAQPQQPQPN